jgi:hypothetical protein
MVRKKVAIHMKNNEYDVDGFVKKCKPKSTLHHPYDLVN